MALIGSVVAASAAGPLKLGIKPVGQAGSYFTLTMQPGESRGLAVQLGNYGTDQARARTFAADAYSLVNGGFGARLEGEATTGSTLWVKYPTADLDLAAGSVVERDFSVTVPTSAQPGEYLTSLVVQNAEPTPADNGADGGSVAFRQVLRQVIAVSIDVPGPRAPALKIGAITVRTVADRSSIAVAIHNTGNIKLRPTGEFVLWDDAGAEITRFPIVMDPVFAHTETYVEIPFAQLLNPGDYSTQLYLADASGVSATSKLPLDIPQPVIDAAPQPIGTAPQLAQANQTSGVQGVPANPWKLVTIAFGAGLLLMLTAGGVGLLLYRRRRHNARALSHQ
ncbi:MAG: hypothetical protein LC797_17070 [Chloroflexi bacterium]|nr:hypothetical protein [Chloroflexota bacterium]